VATDKSGNELTVSSRLADPSSWTRRATRLTVGAPIAYRSATTDQWFRGSMLDISRSGVLFVPDDTAVPDPDLRLVIFLSRAALEAGGVKGLWPDLYCGGPVMRAVLLANGRWAVAVRFDQEWAAQPDDLDDEVDQIHQ
jgi:hypothetical protein